MIMYYSIVLKQLLLHLIRHLNINQKQVILLSRVSQLLLFSALIKYC